MVGNGYPVTQAAFGELVGISQQAVSALIRDGVLPVDGTADTWLRLYCARLREQAAGRLAAGDLDLAGERARLAKEQADKIAMQNAERRGELAPVAAMEMVLAAVGVKVARILDTIPAMVRRRVPGVDAKTMEAVSIDIAKCRNLAASMTLASLDEIDQEDDHQNEAGDDPA